MIALGTQADPTGSGSGCCHGFEISQDLCVRLGVKTKFTAYLSVTSTPEAKLAKHSNGVLEKTNENVHVHVWEFSGPHLILFFSFVLHKFNIVLSLCTLNDIMFLFSAELDRTRFNMFCNHVCCFCLHYGPTNCNKYNLFAIKRN